MFKDSFKFMMAAYSLDAENQIAEGRRIQRLLRLRRELSLHRVLVIKRVFLAVALVGIAGAAYWAHDLGGMLATTAVTFHEPDPSLIAPPKSNAKQMRKLAEMRQQRDKDLEEITK
jgi:hypothetical protein